MIQQAQRRASHRMSIGRNKGFRKSMQMEAVAKMQEQLYKIGAFDGLDYEKVVDGHNGKLAQKALDYANSQANNKNRDEYNALMNTCATQALELVRSGQEKSLRDAVKRIGIQGFNVSTLGTIYNIAKNIANESNPSAALWQSTLWNATGKYSDQIQNENSKTYTFTSNKQ